MTLIKITIYIIINMFAYFEIIVTTFSNTSFFIYTIKLSFDRRIYNPIASLKQWVYGFEESGVNMTSIQVDILCFHRPTRVAILSFSILRPFNYPFNICLAVLWHYVIKADGFPYLHYINVHSLNSLTLLSRAFPTF